MKRMLAGFLLAASMAMASGSPNVSGEWTGKLVVGDNPPEVFSLSLKQDDAGITGSVGPAEGDRMPVKAGKIEGNRVTLEIERDDRRSLRISLVVDGDRMTGDLIATRDGRTRTANLDVSRVK